MKIGIALKEKYPEYERIVSLLPKGALSVYLTPLDEIRIEYPDKVIYVTDDIFRDSIVLPRSVSKYLIQFQ